MQFLGWVRGQLALCVVASVFLFASCNPEENHNPETLSSETPEASREGSGGSQSEKTAESRQAESGSKESSGSRQRVAGAGSSSAGQRSTGGSGGSGSSGSKGTIGKTDDYPVEVIDGSRTDLDFREMRQKRLDPSQLAEGSPKRNKNVKPGPVIIRDQVEGGNPESRRGGTQTRMAIGGDEKKPDEGKKRENEKRDDTGKKELDEKNGENKLERKVLPERRQFPFNTGPPKTHDDSSDPTKGLEVEQPRSEIIRAHRKDGGLKSRIEDSEKEQVLGQPREQSVELPHIRDEPLDEEVQASLIPLLRYFIQLGDSKELKKFLRDMKLSSYQALGRLVDENEPGLIEKAVKLTGLRPSWITGETTRFHPEIGPAATGSLALRAGKQGNVETLEALLAMLEDPEEAWQQTWTYKTDIDRNKSDGVVFKSMTNSGQRVVLERHRDGNGLYWLRLPDHKTPFLVHLRDEAPGNFSAFVDHLESGGEFTARIDSYDLRTQPGHEWTLETLVGLYHWWRGEGEKRGPFSQLNQPGGRNYSDSGEANRSETMRRIRAMQLLKDSGFTAPRRTRLRVFRDENPWVVLRRDKEGLVQVRFQNRPLDFPSKDR